MLWATYFNLVPSLSAHPAPRRWGLRAAAPQQVDPPARPLLVLGLRSQNVVVAITGSTFCVITTNSAANFAATTINNPP